MTKIAAGERGGGEEHALEPVEERLVEIREELFRIAQTRATAGMMVAGTWATSALVMIIGGPTVAAGPLTAFLSAVSISAFVMGAGAVLWTFRQARQAWDRLPPGTAQDRERIRYVVELYDETTRELEVRASSDLLLMVVAGMLAANIYLAANEYVWQMICAVMGAILIGWRFKAGRPTSIFLPPGPDWLPARRAELERESEE